MRRVVDDLHHALRQLRAQPGWSVVLVGVLAAGVALTVAAFLLIDAVLFRPIGIAEQDRVVRIGRTGETREWMNSNAWPVVEIYRTVDEVFTDVAAESWPDALHFRLPDGSRERLRGRAVTGNYFAVLGVDAALGRTLAARDDRAAAEPVAVVSDRFWRRHMQASPDAVGRRITINQTSFTVVGVAPPQFRGMDVESLDVWLPARVVMQPASLWTDRGFNAFEVFGRLRPGVTITQANAAVDAAAMAIGADDGSAHAMAAPVSRFGNFVRDSNEVRGASLLGAGALAMLLLACVNAAGLLLVRAERRRGELALRASLGASRWHLMRQQWAEAVVPVGIACVIGLLLGYLFAVFAIDIAGARGVLGVARSDLPPMGHSLVLVAIVLVACSLVCALPAMVRAGGTRLATEVAGGFGSGARGGRRWHSGRALVLLQFALTVAVAGTGALFVEHFVEQWRAPVGSIREDALVLRLDYEDAAALDAANRGLLDGIRSSGLVSAAAVGGMVPITSSSMTTSPQIGAERRDWSETEGFYNPVSADFFDALGIGLREGRLFDARDVAGAAPVVIVPTETAERMWPGQSAIGQSLQWQVGEGKPAILATVVGVVDDVRYRSIADTMRTMYYVPVEQRHFGAAYSLVVALRAQADRAAVAAMLREAVARAAPGRAPGEIESVRERIGAAIAGPRFVASIAMAFGVLAVLLAATGIYGAFAFLVTARRRELGIRLAIGSTPRALFRLVVGEALIVVGGGIALGLLAGVALARVAAAYAVDLPGVNMATLAGVIAAICIAGLAAVVPSARLAAGTNPQACLRAE